MIACILLEQASTIYLLTIVVGLVLGSPYHFVLGTNGSSSTYNFGYDTRDQSGDGEEHGPRLMREETRLADGTVVGRYGYTDPFGVFRQVKYVAGPNGYYAYEDVGGSGSTSLPLFFKATARQRDLGIFAPDQKSSIDLSAKFNPPLYHPEAHEAEVLPPPPTPSPAKPSSWDLEYTPHHRHQHQASHSINKLSASSSPSSSSSSPSAAPAAAKRQSRVSPLDDNQGLFFSSSSSSSSSSSWSSSLSEPEVDDGSSRYSFPPKTAFQFDYDQESLIRKKVGHQEGEDDLKELESFRLPSNVNVYRPGNKIQSGQSQRLPRRQSTQTSTTTTTTTTSTTTRPSIGSTPMQSPGNGWPNPNSTESIINGTLHRTESDLSHEKSSPDRQDYSASVSVTSVAMETHPVSKEEETIPSESKNSMNHETVSNLKTIQDSRSDSQESSGKEAWKKMESSRTLGVEDLARFRAATIPEVEIMSTYGTRLNHRIDDQPESMGYYEPRVLRGLNYDGKLIGNTEDNFAIRDSVLDLVRFRSNVLTFFSSRCFRVKP